MPKKSKIENIEVKARKPYPGKEERVAMAEAKIERLQKLNETRAALIARTEETLNERKDALAKTEAIIAKEIAKRDRLLKVEAKPARDPEKQKVNELLKALADAGKSVDELLEELKK